METIIRDSKTLVKSFKEDRVLLKVTWPSKDGKPEATLYLTAEDFCKLESDKLKGTKMNLVRIDP